MKVCIAEKPAVAREIARIIGADQRRDGYFEGNGYQVTWTFGHLCTLNEPHDYTPAWKSWTLQSLPMIPERFNIKLIGNKGVEKQFNIISELLKRADEVINCGDAGQEGELIQRWVLHHARCQKPLRRLWISSLTEEAIREGFQNLKSGADFDRLYAAGSARAIGDWLLGMNATRLYTLKYGTGKNILSVGRVQTPTLALLVLRQLEIENFIPEPYWELKTVYRDVTFSVKSGRFKNQDEAAEQLQLIRDRLFRVTATETKPAREHPPKLFDLTSLQVECNRKFGFTAEHTLSLIQSLYEKKLMTYPRVDTTFLPSDIYPKVPEILKGLKPYERHIAPVLAAKIRKSPKVFDDKKITDHHAIIPTGKFFENMLPEEKRVFDLITRRFISVFYPDCMVANTTVDGEVNGIEFKATGKQILDPGWKILYQGEKNDDDQETLLPAFTVGEEGPHDPGVTEKETQPPKYFTEATLLRAMETAGKSIDDEELRDLMKENGIGRPSTRANIIETLFKRGYILRDKKRILATRTGIELIGIIENDLLKSAELTGIWEKKMRDIERGNSEISQFMVELREMVIEVVGQVKRSPRMAITQTEVSVEPEKKTQSAVSKPLSKASVKAAGEKKVQELICPACRQGKVVKGNQSWGCTAFRQGCQFRLPFEFCGKKLSDNQVAQLVLKQTTGIIKGFTTEKGEKTDGKVMLMPDFKLQLILS